MSKQQKLAEAKAKAKQALAKKLATDAKPEDIEAILSQLAQDAAEATESNEDEEEDKKKPAADEEEDEDGKKPAEDEGDDKDDDKPTKAAMDAAIKAAKQDAVKEARASIEALYQAREDVKPLVGRVALDSAEAVYKFALEQKGIDTKGVHPTAYRPMVQMLLKQGDVAPRPAMDAAVGKDTQTKFPNLGRIKQG